MLFSGLSLIYHSPITGDCGHFARAIARQPDCADLRHRIPAPADAVLTQLPKQEGAARRRSAASLHVWCVRFSMDPIWRTG